MFKDQNVHRVNVRPGLMKKEKGNGDEKATRGTMVSGTVDVANER